MDGELQETELLMVSFSFASAPYVAISLKRKAGSPDAPRGMVLLNWQRNGTGVTGNPCSGTGLGCETATQPTSSLWLAIITGSNVSLHVS
jgi:hypothetical protein